jgi:hypothetical protein
MDTDITLRILRDPPLGRVWNRTVGLHFVIFKLCEVIAEEGPLVTKFVQLAGKLF